MRIYTPSQIKGSVVGTIVSNQRKQNTKKVFLITYFRGLENDTKSTECVVKQLFINLWIEISDENVCTNIKILIVR